MKTLIITPENNQDFEFLNELLKKLGYDPHILYDEEKEDMALLKDKKGEYISEEEIMKALGKQ